MKIMFKKIIFSLFIFNLLFIILTPVIAMEQQEEIFEINKVEVNQGENILINININKINISKFNIELHSSESLENANIEEGINNIGTNISNNEIIFNVDKEHTNISSISLNYTISESIEIGKDILFSLKIISENQEDIVINKVLKIVEKQNDNNKIEELNENSVNNNKQNNKNTMNSGLSITNENNKQIDNSMKQITYNGSPNNYLKSLSVSNYELDKIFLKERLTYFLEVENEVTSINVNATKEVSSSKISISGNSNLKVGLNKVIINVEAQNGNVKTYRIYVTRMSN